MELEIFVERVRGNEHLDDFFFPEFAVAIGEGGLDVNVAADPAEIKRGVVIPKADFRVFAFVASTFVFEKGLEAGGFGPD